jgi:formylglycine-generating enzyme required for sulfatase activity
VKRALLFVLVLGGSVIAGTAAAETPTVRLPAGTYVPFYARGSAKSLGDLADLHRPQRVESFRIDQHAVTNKEFLAFVLAHPEWRRSQMKRLFADAQYLSHWKADVLLRDESDGDRPVTNVSWFAAEAYCRAQGKHLPSTDQWEYALADAGRGREALRTRTLAWYATPNAPSPPVVQSGISNAYGVSGLTGIVWEWTLDFNSMMSGPDLREAGAKVCGGASLGAADTTDYAAFMRYSMRASLKASYTTKNLGFRCASDDA